MPTYNGWSNYETWLVALWLDQDNYQPNSTDVSSLSQELKDFIDECMPETTGLYHDLLNAALGSVDWYEVSEHLLSD